MMQLNANDIQNFEQRYRTTLINSLSGFKSLQVVGTINQAGETNAAIFNSIVHIGAHPPLIGMVMRPAGPEHDTLNNILATGVYTLNNVAEEYYHQAHQTSARYVSGESEFDACGLDEEYADGFSAPFVKQASVKIGLSVAEIIPVKVNNTTIVIGAVQHVFLPADCVGIDGYIDHSKAGSLTVCGLDAYHSTNKLTRLAYAKPDKAPQELHF